MPPTRSAIAAIVAVSLHAVPAGAQAASKLDGYWQGNLAQRDGPLPVQMTLHTDSDGVLAGTMNFPTLRIRDIPVCHVQVHGTYIEFTNTGIPGGPTFRAVLTGDGALDGDALQSGRRAKFLLTRSSSPPPPSDSAAAAAGYRWPVPRCWGREEFALPPQFAADFPYHGEQLSRLAPGFFGLDTDDRWSYVFAWWLTDSTAVDARGLTDALNRYIRDQTKDAVPKPDPHLRNAPPVVIRADLRPGPPTPSGAPTYRGVIQTLDLLTPGHPTLTLRARIETRACPVAHHQVVLVALTPADDNDPIWRELTRVAGTFQCDVTGS